MSEGFPNFSAFIFTLIYSLYLDLELISLLFLFGISPNRTEGMDSTEGQEAVGESCLSEKLYLDLRSWDSSILHFTTLYNSIQLYTTPFGQNILIE